MRKVYDEGWIIFVSFHTSAQVDDFQKLPRLQPDVSACIPSTFERVGGLQM
jgi:hypothetical protein